MKVTQEEGFITIRLESEEETDSLWHILNCSPEVSLADYMKEDYGRMPTHLGNMQTKMWLELNRYHKVRK